MSLCVVVVGRCMTSSLQEYEARNKAAKETWIKEKAIYEGKSDAKPVPAVSFTHLPPDVEEYSPSAPTQLRQCPSPFPSLPW